MPSAEDDGRACQPKLARGGVQAEGERTEVRLRRVAASADSLRVQLACQPKLARGGCRPRVSEGWRPHRDCVCRTGLADCCDELPEGSGVRNEGHREGGPPDAREIVGPYFR